MLRLTLLPDCAGGLKANEKNDTMLAVDGDGEGDLEYLEEDGDFIDDEGVAIEERVDFADDANAIAFDEAEEAKDDMDDELDRMFGRGARRESTGGDRECSIQAENLMAQMEAALEADLEAFSRKEPALHKLRMLKKAQDALSIQKMHEFFMSGGILGLLKGWLEPMPDGSLPNTRVRGGVLSMLQNLRINCANEDHKEQLKKSGVGRVVMFLSKLPDETPENRRLAQSLVESWSRPILGSSVSIESIQRNDGISKAKSLASKSSTSNGGGIVDDDHLQSGHPESRHAVIPRAAELDYVIRPKSRVSMESSGPRTVKVSEPKLLKKLRANANKK